MTSCIAWVGKNAWNPRIITSLRVRAPYVAPGGGENVRGERIYSAKSTRRPRGVPIPRALRGNGSILTLYNY